MAAAKASEERKARTIWLHAWHDPVAGLKAYSSCVRLADISDDGDSKLLVAGSDCKLRIYKGTSLLSENVLLDAPVSICAFHPDANRPRTPSVAVAAGACVFIYRNLRPHYKFCLPEMEVSAQEADVWASLNSGRSVVADARAALVTARDGGELLSSLSHELISLEDPAEGDRLLADRKGLPLTRPTVATCMEVLKREMEDDVRRWDHCHTPPAPRPRAINAWPTCCPLSSPPLFAPSTLLLGSPSTRPATHGRSPPNPSANQRRVLLLPTPRHLCWLAGWQDAVSMLVVGTESGLVLVLDPTGATVQAPTYCALLPSC